MLNAGDDTLFRSRVDTIWYCRRVLSKCSRIVVGRYFYIEEHTYTSKQYTDCNRHTAQVYRTQPVLRSVNLHVALSDL